MSDNYEYSTSDIAKYYGLSAKGLAYYEKEGIISPVRKADSSYRVYSLDDCYCMYHAKFYRNNGITIKKTADFLKGCSLEEIMCDLDAQQKEEELQMRIHTQVIEKTRWILEQVKDYEINGQRFETAMSPVFHRLYIRTFEFSHISTKEESEEFQNWNEYVPLNTASLLYRKDLLLQKRDLLNVNIGNIIRNEDNSLIQLKQSDRVTTYESRFCLKTILKGDGNEIDHIGWLESSLAWIENNGYEPDGDVLTEMLLVTGEKNKRTRYDLAWMPIKKK